MLPTRFNAEAELANDALASGDNTSTGNTDDLTSPSQKQRPDDNWRVQRAVLERDKNLFGVKLS